MKVFVPTSLVHSIDLDTGQGESLHVVFSELGLPWFGILPVYHSVEDLKRERPDESFFAIDVPEPDGGMN